MKSNKRRVRSMDPIPAWVKRLWNMWDVRVLVLLSLFSQTILHIFGKRRKNMSSLWVQVVVWSAYLVADWVATVALGKLSDAQAQLDDDSYIIINVLRAIWAPLLLLHLGGPDSITAYSTEDNQLWLRHLMGLVVQAVVAVYVILMSWGHSWSSFLPLVVLVAGMIKYGERTWVLMSVSEVSSNIVPFSKLHASFPALPGNEPEERYINSLYIASDMVSGFLDYMKNYDVGRRSYGKTYNHGRGIDYFKSIFWDTTKVGMGLMYDLLHTKATIIYTKRGCIFRSVSFSCTVSTLIGVLWLIVSNWKNLKQHEHHHSIYLVDIVITGVLLIGALVLEIYAVSAFLLSDWMMLWVVMLGKKERVVRLCQRFPRFFPGLGRKCWSNRMGQFDLLGFCIKEDQPLLAAAKSTLMFVNRRIRVPGLLAIQDKFSMYLHKTSVDVPGNIDSMIIDYMEYLSGVPRPPRFPVLIKRFGNTYRQLLLSAYIATEICYQLDLEFSSNTSQKISNNIRETCRTLSFYMMYLYATCPWLLPIPTVQTEDEEYLRKFIDNLKLILKKKTLEEDTHVGEPNFFDNQALEAKPQLISRSTQSIPSTWVGEANWKKLQNYPCEELEAAGEQRQELRWVLSRAQKLVAIWKMKEEKEEAARWEMVKQMWLAMLFYAAINAKTHHHLQCLRQGGELLTLLWFCMPQSKSNVGIDILLMNEIAGIDTELRNEIIVKD